LIWNFDESYLSNEDDREIVGCIDDVVVNIFVIRLYSYS
jgi:hypothetical protein